ncbi:MAG: hypothetical protein GX772_14200, partial [Alcaligenaceae bacterium]|nr:hypothetical protein [Alcaligenaceae bacterium]
MNQRVGGESAPGTKQRTADLYEVIQTELTVTVLIQQITYQTTHCATLLLCLMALLVQCT